jgi:hypothetical protein
MRALQDQPTPYLGATQDGRAWSIFGQLTAILLGSLTRSHRPVGPMACPARIEPATYALEAGKMSWNSSRNNAFKVSRSAVAYTPRMLVGNGIAWMSDGIGR